MARCYGLHSLQFLEAQTKRTNIYLPICSYLHLFHKKGIPDKTRHWFYIEVHAPSSVQSLLHMSVNKNTSEFKWSFTDWEKLLHEIRATFYCCCFFFALRNRLRWLKRQMQNLNNNQNLREPTLRGNKWSLHKYFRIIENYPDIGVLCIMSAGRS